MKSASPPNVLAQTTPEQQAVIVQVLEEVAPLQFDIAGVETARRIAAGGSFQSVEGGRHLDLGDTISLLSGIATLAQMLLLTGFWVRRRIAEAREKQQREWHALFGDLREQARRDERLAALLERNPDVLLEIAEVLDRHYVSGEDSSGDDSSGDDASPETND